MDLRWVVASAVAGVLLHVFEIKRALRPTDDHLQLSRVKHSDPVHLPRHKVGLYKIVIKTLPKLNAHRNNVPKSSKKSSRLGSGL